MNEMFSQGGKGSTGILTNKQAIARKFGVKQNEVVYFAVGVDLGGYKVIYDKATQRAYSLPVLPVGTTAVSLNEQAILVHSAGTIDLGELAATRREFVSLSDSFVTGLVVNTRNELLFHNGIGYTYLGSLPVTIPAGTNPVGSADWKPQTDPDLREELADTSSIVNGDALVGVRQPFAGAVSRTQHDKNKEYVSVTDFITPGESDSADKTYAFQAAVDSLTSAGGEIHIPNGGFWVVEGIVTLNKSVTIRGSGSTPTTLIKNSNTNSTFFNVAAESCSIRDLRLIGAAGSTGGFAITTATNASRLHIDNVQIRATHSGINLKANLFSLSHIEIVDINSPGGVGIEVDQSGVVDGVGLITSTVIQNGDGVEPYAGIFLRHAIGILISDTQLMQAGKAMVMQPGATQGVSSIKIVNTYFDTSDDGGLLIDNTSGGDISRITIADSWLASSKNGNGMLIQSGSNIHGLKISTCEFYDSVTGINVGDNVTLQNMDVTDCVFSGHTSADISIGSNVANFSFRGCRSGAVGGFAASPIGLYLNPGCNNYSIQDNDFHTINDASYPTTGALISNNRQWGYASAPYDPPSLTNNTGAGGTVGVPNARLGDVVDVSFSNDLQGIQLTAWVSSDNTVSFRMFNSTGATIDLPSGIVKARIKRMS